MKLTIILCLFTSLCFGQNTSKVDSLEKGKADLKEINLFYTDAQTRSSMNEFCGGCVNYIDSIMKIEKNTYPIGQGDLIYRKKLGDTVISMHPFFFDAPVIEINLFYIAGLKKIRHDAILKRKFRKAHEIKNEIKKIN